MSRTSQSLALSSPFVGSLIGFILVACSVDTQGTGKNAEAGGKTGSSSQVGGAQNRGGGSSIGGTSMTGGNASSESSSSSGGSDANSGGTSSESSSSSGGSDANSGGTSSESSSSSGGSGGEQGGNGGNGGTSNSDATLAGGNSSSGGNATIGGSIGAGGTATGGFVGTAGSTLIASGGTVGAGGSSSLTTGTQASPICNDFIADAEFSFSHVTPSGISKKVAICKMRGDMTEEQKNAFSAHSACAWPAAAVLDISAYSAAEKHTFVTALAQNLHDLTGYKSTADGYYLVDLLGTFYSAETYQSGACECNSTAFEYPQLSTGPSLVSLYFYQHPGCSNTGTNAILGSVYGVAHTQLIWPGYTYDDVGVMGAVPYLSGDCSSCVGTVQPIPNQYTEAYGRTTACNNGTYSAVTPRVVCALDE